MAFERQRLIAARTRAHRALLKLNPGEIADFNRQRRPSISRRSLEKENGVEPHTNVYFKQMHCRGNIEGVHDSTARVRARRKNK